MFALTASQVVEFPLWNSIVNPTPPPAHDPLPATWWMERAPSVLHGIQLLHVYPLGDHLARRFAAECLLHVNNKAPASGGLRTLSKDVRFRQVSTMVDMAGQWGMAEKAWQRRRLIEMVRFFYPEPL